MNTSDTWRPSAHFSQLRKRSQIINKIRHFFAELNILEVETPLLSRSTVTDLHIASLATFCQVPNVPTRQCFYLQTSPEFAMKRLLAAGSGSIYQICKAFRDGDAGLQHNPEFTLLEWYMLNYDHHKLMDQVNELLKLVLSTPDAERITYRQAFLNYLQLDPFTATITELQACAQQHGIEVQSLHLDNHDAWLHLLISHLVEPKLGLGQPTFIYDYPATQAALARIHPGNPPLAERFEVYVQGIELANGYHELTDAEEQRYRFVHDLQLRRAQQLPADMPLPQHLLDALSHGLPNCAGVALGIDRLIMAALNIREFAGVTAFTIEQA